MTRTHCDVCGASMSGCICKECGTAFCPECDTIIGPGQDSGCAFCFPAVTAFRTCKTNLLLLICCKENIDAGST